MLLLRLLMRVPGKGSFFSFMGLGIRLLDLAHPVQELTARQPVPWLIRHACGQARAGQPSVHEFASAKAVWTPPTFRENNTVF